MVLYKDYLNLFFVPRMGAQAKAFEEFEDAVAIPEGIDHIEHQHKGQ